MDSNSERDNILKLLCKEELDWRETNGLTGTKGSRDLVLNKKQIDLVQENEASERQI